MQGYLRGCFCQTEFIDLGFYFEGEVVKILSKAACLRALKALNMFDYIKVTENPNKEMLSVLSDVELAKVSCEKKTQDNITIAPKIEEILDSTVAHRSAPKGGKK